MKENGICSACFLRKCGAAGEVSACFQRGNPLSHRCAMPAPPKGGAFMNLPVSTNKAPPSGELDATSGSGLRGFSRPLGEGGLPRSGKTEGVLPASGFILEPETFRRCSCLSLWERCHRVAMTERAHAVSPNTPSVACGASSPKGTPFGAAAKFPATAKSRPLGEGGCERSEQTEGVSLYNRYNPHLSRPY